MKRVLLLTALALAIGFTACRKTTTHTLPFVFEDSKFKEYVVSKFDKNGDGEINKAEAAEIKDLGQMWEMGFTSLKGIEAFPNLEIINCDDNLLTELDVSKNLKLKELWVGASQLTTLDVRNNTKLEILAIGENPITELDLSKNTALKELKCAWTKIASLELGENPSLVTLWCDVTSLQELNLSKNLLLKELSCAATKITTLDLRYNTGLAKLYCDSNPQLTKLILKSGSRTWGAFEFEEFMYDPGLNIEYSL